MFNIAIGYDNAFKAPAYVAAESILQNSSKPLNFLFLNKGNLPEYTRPRTTHDSTEFSNSRFLVPHLYGYTGWTLFIDNDVVVDGDIAELFNYCSDQYTVLVVKHNQVVKDSKKFLGREQWAYKYKNWSSVMLFNNSRCRELTPDYVNRAGGFDLHQFRWVEDHDRIGSLPLEWNYLVDNDNQTGDKPKLLHYTNGGPWFKESVDCSHARKWLDVWNSIKPEVDPDPI